MAGLTGAVFAADEALLPDLNRYEERYRLTGRAVATTWRPAWKAVLAMAPLAAAARFVHFALFHGNLLSITSYVCDLCLFVVVALLAWQATRAAQMVRQYPWLYVRSGPLSWRQIGQENPR